MMPFSFSSVCPSRLATWLAALSTIALTTCTDSQNSADTSRMPPAALNTMALSATSAPDAAAPAQTDVPLSPSRGGQSILPEVLREGDVILCTTSEKLSDVIRRFSGQGPVSHVRVYIGTVANIPMVVEAIGSNVTKKPLDQALAHDQLAVAFRVRNMSGDQRAALLAFLNGQVGKPYNYWGVITYPIKKFFYANRSVSVNFANENPKGYFCSQLVEEAYKRSGMPVFTATAYPPSPNELASLAIIQDKLEYVGHLRTP